MYVLSVKYVNRKITMREKDTKKGKQQLFLWTYFAEWFLDSIYIHLKDWDAYFSWNETIVLIDATSMREYWEHARESMSYRFL